MILLITSDQLLERAHRAQLRVRSKQAEPRDRFLVYVDEAAEPGTHTNGGSGDVQITAEDGAGHVEEEVKAEEGGQGGEG